MKITLTVELVVLYVAQAKYVLTVNVKFNVQVLIKLLCVEINVVSRPIVVMNNVQAGGGLAIMEQAQLDAYILKIAVQKYSAASKRLLLIQPDS